MRAAIYARMSTDKQADASVPMLRPPPPGGSEGVME